MLIEGRRYHAISCDIICVLSGKRWTSCDVTDVKVCIRMHTRAEIVYVMFLMCLRVRVMAQGTYKLGTCLNMFEHV